MRDGKAGRKGAVAALSPSSSCLCFEPTGQMAPTPRDDILIDIDDKEPLIPAQVRSLTVALYPQGLALANEGSQ